MLGTAVTLTTAEGSMKTRTLAAVRAAATSKQGAPSDSLDSYHDHPFDRLPLYAPYPQDGGDREEDRPGDDEVDAVPKVVERGLVDPLLKAPVDAEPQEDASHHQGHDLESIGKPHAEKFLPFFLVKGNPMRQNYLMIFPLLQTIRRR